MLSTTPFAHSFLKGQRALTILIAGCFLSLCMSATARAEEFQPNDFDVQGADMTPTLKSAADQCQLQSDGSELCTRQLESVATAKVSHGTAKDLRADDPGNFYISCSTVQNGEVSFNKLNGVIASIVELSGTRYQACNWQMDLDSGSTLLGTVEGNFRLEPSTCREKEPTIAAVATVYVHVIGGTGRFENRTGEAVLTDESEPFTNETLSSGEDCHGENHGEGSDGSDQRRSSVHSLASKAQPWRLKLRRGQLKPRILLPSVLEQNQAVGLRVLSASKSSCAARASSGSQSVNLGQARDRVGRGEIAFKGALRDKLSAGKWKIKLTCTYRSKGKSKTVASSKAVELNPTS